MSTPYLDAFFDLHRGLPREGPGEEADVAWAANTAQLRLEALICDAACGPGADIAALRRAAPQGRVTAMDKIAHFVAEAKARHGDDPSVDLRVGDMMALDGPFDLIWCAGALYFVGITEGLKRWRTALAPGGVVAFSEVCWFSADRPAEAVSLWSDYPAMTDAEGIADHVAAAGYTTIATRKLSDEAWEGYYRPLDQRIAALAPTATGALVDVLAEARREAEVWRAHRGSFGYLLSVVRPVAL